MENVLSFFYLGLLYSHQLMLVYGQYAIIMQNSRTHTHLSSSSARVDTDVTLSPSIARHYGAEIPPILKWNGNRISEISFTLIL